LTVAIARWLLRRRKRQLEHRTFGTFDRAVSAELDRIVAARWVALTASTEASRRPPVTMRERRPPTLFETVSA
jgi:hypothetical protein